ncbi:hypothetical protein AZI86_01060 [Bdellovibrio bacteriovorus]|uniref:DUF4423 domain-containing protein n=1 Tax=Bdellovibrio bacteriovorus TaxID=959 RepID=A0A150WNB6_BDEBC|nr:DUF4423 domain-containing protein [Bdellovibrio bacteriovorus]KYG65695.1 hypothetical protein AZI86_01060 [Bdellovibrio bacteriovorus]
MPHAQEKLNKPFFKDFNSAADFLFAKYLFYRQQGHFSLRRRCIDVGKYTQAYVSQILNKKRNISENNLPALAEIFLLSSEEEKQILKSLNPTQDEASSFTTEGAHRRIGRLIKHWYYPYIWSAANLKNFTDDPQVIQKMLLGLVPAHNIEKAITYFLSEGLWRKTMGGKVVPDTHQLIDEKTPAYISEQLHKKALEIVAQKIETRQTPLPYLSTTLLAVDSQKLQLIQERLNSLEQELRRLNDQPSPEANKLIQVTLHMVTVGETVE